MRIRIRTATSADKQEILSVIASYPDKWDEKIAERYFDDFFSAKPGNCLKGDEIFVGISKNRIIGVIGYAIDRYESYNYWLGWFYVHKKASRKGVGTELLSYVISILKNKGVDRIFVNTSSHSFYKKALICYLNNGFRIEANIRDYYEKGEDQIILSRPIR